MTESDPKQLTCPNGHRFDAPDSGDAASSVVCPECDADVDVSSSETSDSGGSRGRGLWAMMGQTAGAETTSAETSSAVSSAAEEAASASSVDSAEEIPDDAPDPVAADTDSDVEEQSATDALPERPAFMLRTQKVLPIEARESSEPDADSEGDAGSEGSRTESEEASESADPVDADGARARGLWAMMGVPEAAPADDKAADPESSDSDSSARTAEFDTAPPGELNAESAGLDSDSDAAADSDAELNDSQSDEDDFDDDGALSDEDEEDGWDIEDPQTDLDDLDSLLPPPELTPQDGPPPGQRKSVAALALGIAAALLAGLTVLPWFWVKVPCTLAGLGALTFGYQATGERRRARESKPAVVAMAGMVLGLAGMFAGPAFLNGLGEDYRERASSEAVKANLVRIGEALDQYYAEHARYPSGGDWEEIDGIDVGMHGWMTSLLPYLEESQIVGAIDRTKPWNDPVNLPAMSQPVSTFLVPDVEHLPNSQGYATTHYAGVGGEILTDEGRYELGVFGRDSQVTLQDITDGRSQTMVAGEISRNYPPWGSTGNWRQTGRGLNKDVAGFGNADGTGAHFLMADGSVRFFSNRTSPEVLDRLSTRDAGDEAP